MNPGDTTAYTTRQGSPTSALNEGRGVNPGDTGNRQPLMVLGHALPRSTKAGA